MSAKHFQNYVDRVSTRVSGALGNDDEVAVSDRNLLERLYAHKDERAERAGKKQRKGGRRRSTLLQSQQKNEPDTQPHDESKKEAPDTQPVPSNGVASSEHMIKELQQLGYNPGFVERFNS